MVGIVVLNYNTPDDVFRCVETIKKYTTISYHIYVVDNNSKDSSLEQFETSFKGDSLVTVLASHVNGGFSAGNNIGIKEAIKDSCDYVCLINADILLVEDTISLLVDKMEKNSEIGIAAPSVISPDSTDETQFARNKLTFGNFLVEKTFFGKFKHFRKKHPRYQVENKAFVDDYLFYGMTYGCIYVVRSDFFVKTGYMDEIVFLFNEEDILAHKLEHEHLKTLITPKTKVIHNHHSSISKTSIANRVFHFRVSELYVLRKYDGASILKLMPVIFTFNMVWILKSIRSKDYRSKCKDFLKKTHFTYKIKRKSGLKY